MKGRFGVDSMTVETATPITFDIEIERMLPGGVGLAHAEGLTIFVSLAAPGDVLRVEIDRTRGKVAFASIKEIIKPSPVRVEPPCPYFGRCGGCDFQQLDYESQLKTKLEIIQDCLRRIAKIEALPEIPIHPSPKQWHYRARANWQFDPMTSRLGYFARVSHSVCDVAECAVLTPELETTLEKLRQGIRSNSLRLPATEIEAVAGDDAVSVFPALEGFPSTDVTRTIGGETYSFNAECFFQINHDLLESMSREAISEARGKFALDLFCGVGLFTLPLARRFEHVVGVESSPRACAFARYNLQSARLENAEIFTARLGDWLKEHSGSLGPVDFLLLDPPRSGCENAVIAGLLALWPRQISYVSCDPATLARDLKKLIAGGYTIDSIIAFDMFPQTHHVETLVRLSSKT
jgi:tRNA/tmRNA/rRNA uracil-C5-methylase (TrmA/RlmC/RlmD family)